MSADPEGRFVNLLWKLHDAKWNPATLRGAEVGVLLLLHELGKNGESSIRISISEIAKRLGYAARNPVADAIKRLERRGQIEVGEKGKGNRNSYRLTYKVPAQSKPKRIIRATPRLPFARSKK